MNLKCTYHRDSPPIVILMGRVTEEADPRGIPVGYPDPETAEIVESEGLTAETVGDRYIACARCNEVVILAAPHVVQCPVCGAMLAPGDYGRLLLAACPNHFKDGSLAETREEGCSGGELLGHVYVAPEGVCP